MICWCELSSAIVEVPPACRKIYSCRSSTSIISPLGFSFWYSSPKMQYYNSRQWAGVQEYPIFVNELILMDFLLCKTADDLKGTCNCTTCLREILHKVTWLATVVARIIQSFPFLARYQSCVVFCSSFLCIKYVSYALFVLASSSVTAIFVGWQFLVSLILPYVRMNRSNDDVVVTVYSSLPTFSPSLSWFNRKLYLFFNCL